MSNATNLVEKSFTEVLKDQSTNFVNFTITMKAMLNNRDELKKNIEAIKELDYALTELKKVSEETEKVATEM